MIFEGNIAKNEVWKTQPYIYISVELLFSHSVVFNSLRPFDCSTPGFPVLQYLQELAQSCVHWVVMPSNHLILCHSIFLLPSVFPNIRVFSDEPTLHIRWAKYWSFSLSTSPSSEYSGLISFRILISLLSKGLRVFSSTTIWSHQLLGAQPSIIWSHIHTWLLVKP